jgi:hypothetical protein
VVYQVQGCLQAAFCSELIGKKKEALARDKYYKTLFRVIFPFDPFAIAHVCGLIVVGLVKSLPLQARAHE